MLGSGRRLLDDPALLRTYRPDRAARPPLLLANLGAAQLRGRGGPERAERLLDLLDADGLSVHLNPLQEAVQPEGQPDFSGVLAGIAACVARLAPRPVVVKEVGFGLGPADVVRAGRRRRGRGRRRRRGRNELGADRGSPRPAGGRGRRTPSRAGACPPPTRCARAVAADPELPVIASGGVRDGVEVAKCLALGAAPPAWRARS